MKVLDASLLVEFLSNGAQGPAVQQRLAEIPGWTWAPALVDAEVGHALRKAVLRRRLSPSAAEAAIEELMEMPIERVSHRFLADRAWQLHENISFYDGLYVALAEALEAPLLTADARLAKAPGTYAQIEVIPV